MLKLPFTHLFGGKSHDPAIELAEKLKEMAPMPVSKVFFGASGSDANDTQIKLVWYYNNALGRPKKKKIIARLKGYHGVTVATASLTGLPNNHIDFDLPIAEHPAHLVPASLPLRPRGRDGGRVRHAPRQRTRRTDPEGGAGNGRRLHRRTGGRRGRRDRAAGDLLREDPGGADQYDVLFIADEVICGFGRLGTPFGSTAMGMTPDTMSLAKALTSAYFPLSAVLIPDAIHQAMIDESRKIGTFGHGYTYSGHPVGAAVALKTLEIYERDNVSAMSGR